MMASNITRKKIIIWGGFWGLDKNVLDKNNINSHASVSAFFLQEALLKYFDVVLISDFYKINDALSHKDAIAIISTFQRGFTKLHEVCGKEVFDNIKNNFPGQLCSITDLPEFRLYYENILFTVRPYNRSIKNIVKVLLLKPKVIEIGWCADPVECFPTKTSDDEFNVFVDHGNYAGSDINKLFYDALLNLRLKDKNVRIYTQTNNGIEEVYDDFETDNDYDRSAKVNWLDLINTYKRMHVFCCTHRESAGLAAIEAAMCGAKLYVPFSGDSYISKELLEPNIMYTSINCDVNSITKALDEDFTSGIDRMANHNATLKNNTWERAANTIWKTFCN